MQEMVTEVAASAVATLEEVSLCLSLRFKGLSIYLSTLVVSYFTIILYNITSLAYNQYTDI